MPDGPRGRVSSGRLHMRMPIGIPEPPFGYHETAPPPPSPWNDEVPGYYYVDWVNGATGRPYGKPSAPRKTIPLTLPAGAKVYLNGTYNQSHIAPNTITASGTPDQLVWIRSMDGQRCQWMTRTSFQSCSHLIVENVDWHLSSGVTGVDFGNIDHGCLRHSSVYGNLLGGGTAVRGSYFLLWDNYINQSGDPDSIYDEDSHGLQIGTPSHHIWVLYNEMCHIAGTGVPHTNILSPSLITHTYIGGNHMWDTRQGGFSTKNAQHVVFSENYVHDGHWNEYQDIIGGGCGFQYEPEYVWYLCNRLERNGQGFYAGSGNASRRDIYFIGNTVRDALNPEGAGFAFNGDVNGFGIFNNTVYNCPLGLSNGYYTISPVVANNIFHSCGQAIKFPPPYNSGTDTDLRNCVLFPFNVNWNGTTYTDLAAFQAATGKGQGCLDVDPLLIDVSGGNFRPRTESPVRNAGSLEDVFDLFYSLYGLDIRYDIDHQHRPIGPAWDIGAFEVTG